MGERREAVTILGPVVSSGATTQTYGPIDMREMSLLTFSVQYSITAGTAPNTTVQVLSTCIARPIATVAATVPQLSIASISYPNPIPGFSIVEGTGTITMNASTIGTYEQTWIVRDFGQFVYFVFTQPGGGGGGTVTTSIYVSGWPY